MSDETKIVFWKYDTFPSCLWGELIGDIFNHDTFGKCFRVKGYGRMNFDTEYIIAILPKDDAVPIINSLVELNSIYSEVNRELSSFANEILDSIRYGK